MNRAAAILLLVWSYLLGAVCSSASDTALSMAWSHRGDVMDWRVRKARRIGGVPADVLEETIGKLLALVDPDAAR